VISSAYGGDSDDGQVVGQYGGLVKLEIFLYRRASSPIFTTRHMK
jgi:hypothetical protein